MLELRSACENCQTKLPPDSGNAMICSFECTFCRDCVDNVLDNVCPNCGGAFCTRPARPAFDFVNDRPFETQSGEAVNKPVDSAIHQSLIRKIRNQQRKANT